MMDDQLLSPIETPRTSSLYRNAPIAVTDSGVGGLTILREIRRLLPAEDIVFLADQVHVPYGERQLEEVRSFQEGITRFFLTRTSGDANTVLEAAKLVVVACNTASAAALHYLRETFHQIKFVGLEPAVKPAALSSRKKNIGVIATSATFEGELYASLIDRFAKDIRVHTRACPEFVVMVESGQVDPDVIAAALQPLKDKDIDQLVLGCTHFPFLKAEIQRILGPAVEIIDPGPAVARQVVRVLEREDAKTTRTTEGRITAITTGSLDYFRQQIDTLLDFEVQRVHWAMWNLGRLVLKV